MTTPPHIQIFIDFKSPASYLAMKPTLELIGAMHLRADWYPTRTRQRNVPEEKANETKGERHIRIREMYRRRAFQHYAKVQRIPLTFPPSLFESDLALAALEATHSLSFAERAFDAYWRSNLDLNDRSVVNELLAAAGAAELPDESECARLLQTSTDRAQEQGVIDAPAYLIGEELFIGREHLPLLRELLDAA